MKKTKIIAILSSLVMLTAMTGIAVAMDMEVLPNGDVPLIPGSFVKTTVYLTDINDPTMSRQLDVIGAGFQNIGDLTFYVLDPYTGISSSESTGSITYGYTPNADSYTLEVYIKAAAGTEGNTYTLWYHDMSDDMTEIVAATVKGKSIPEFASVAIPAVAILGLFLFFNHRKRKEE